MTEQDTVTVAPVSSENKRKGDDLQHQLSHPEDLNASADAENVNGDKPVDSDVKEAKKIRLNENPAGDENGDLVENVSVEEVDGDAENMENMENTEEKVESENKVVDGEVRSEKKLEKGGNGDKLVVTVQLDGVEEVENKGNQEVDSTAVTVEGGVKVPSGETVQEDSSVVKDKNDGETDNMSRTMEIPNNKVGVLIGKAGDTIRYLQLNSGSKIQITRDAEADPHAPTRPVELIGSLESIEKAEKLIKDVISEADAGGVPSLVARGIATAQTAAAAEQTQMHVPNDKVGMIIGKGGETIKYLQATSGARIQLIPQHLPEGDQSTERIVRITGDKKQIEIAKEMIMEVMTQPLRHSPRFGGYHQQPDRFRGASGPWGPRDGPYGHHSRYDHLQRGYPQNPMHRPPAYDHYPGPNYGPRGGYGPGWQQQPPMHRPPYDNYGRSGHMEGYAGPRGHPAAPSMGPGPNYNYGYPSQYPHSAPPPSGYGHVYNELKYGAQVPVEHPYGGQGNAQPPYSQSYSSYAPNQQYGTPAPYSAPQAYGAPRPIQPEAPYQAGNPTAVQPYSQQPALYPTGAPVQASYPTYPTVDNYAQQQQAAATAYGQQAASGYSQPVVQVSGSYVQQPASGYAQPVAQQAPGAYVQQATPGYAQPVAQQTTSTYSSQGVLPGSYGSYPATQTGYADQSAKTSTVYTYQAATTVPDPNAAYSASQSSQHVYSQTQPQPAQATSYDQSAKQ